MSFCRFVWVIVDPNEPTKFKIWSKNKNEKNLNFHVDKILEYNAPAAARNITPKPIAYGVVV